MLINADKTLFTCKKKKFFVKTEFIFLRNTIIMDTGQFPRPIDQIEESTSFCLALIKRVQQKQLKNVKLSFRINKN